MSAFIHEFRHHVRCVLTVPFGASFRIIGGKWITQSSKSFTVKKGKTKHLYNVDLNCAYYSKKGNPILVYDIHKTNPIDFRIKKPAGKSSNLYHTLINDKSAEEILTESKTKSMLILVGVLIVGIIIIGGYSLYQMGQMNDKIISLTRDIGAIIQNVTKGGGVVIG